MHESIMLNPNKIVRALEKPAADFTKQDIIRFIEANGIRMLNFRYVGGDGRLKKLNFVINSRSHLDRVLSMGERVDGSSLFSFVDADSSDLYVVPRYRTAFVNPFTEVPTIDLICSYYDFQGNPLESSPDHVIRKAQKRLKERTGLTMHALGELEYYLFSEVDRIYPIVEQKGYHESHRGADIEVNLLKKVRLEIGVNDNFVKPTVDAIIKGARTGNIGDGKIFITDLQECIRIRTGETGGPAIG